MKMLRDMEVDDMMADSVAIEPLALNEEFVRLPADLAYWNAKLADARRAHWTAKFESDRVRAQVWLETRERLQAAGVKTTEAMIEAAVEVSEEWQKQRAALVEAEAEKDHLYGVVDAVRAKKDMLVSLGAQLRAEMDGDPLLRDEVKGHRLTQMTRGR